MRHGINTGNLSSKRSENISVILLVLVLFAANLKAKETITLVKDAHTSYSIVLPPNPSIVDTFAAHELQRYIREISNCSLNISSEGNRHIYIGTPFLKKFNLNLQSGNDAFIIKTIGDNLILAGINDRSSLYAVYTLLERIGCRWYAPDFSYYGKKGREIIPDKKTIIIPDYDLVEKASFKYRTKNIEEGWSHTRKNVGELIDWMAKNKMNVLNAQAIHIRPIPYNGKIDTVTWNYFRVTAVPELEKRGMIAAVGGHGYQNWLPADRYFKKHPDWFGMMNGKRSESPYIVFNSSNKDAVDTFTENIIKYLKHHPEIKIFELWPPDSEHWSEDSASVALGPPSVRMALIVNHVARVLADTLPDVKVECIAYSHYLAPPKGIEFDPRVLVDFCPYSRTYQYGIHTKQSPINEFYDENLLKWIHDRPEGTMGIYSYYLKYVWASLPVIIPHVIAEDLKYYHSLGIYGLCSYSEPGNWATYELNHYIIAKELWNANLPVDSLIDDYCQNSFGAGSEKMHRFFTLIEETVPTATRIYQSDLYPFIRRQEKKPIVGEFDSRRSIADVLVPFLDSLKVAGKLVEGALRDDTNPRQHDLIEKYYLSWRYAMMDAKIKHWSAQLMEENNTQYMDEINAETKKMHQLYYSHSKEGVFLLSFYVNF